MLIFIDIETTGLESIDKIVSIGLIAIEKDNIFTKYELVNEGKKILAEASSVNHITNEMLKGKPKFIESEIYKFIQENNNEDTILIAHNIKFDLEKLSSAAIDWKGNIIDTLRVTKHLIPECERYALQFLRYELKLYKEEVKFTKECGIENSITAHNALSDAIVTKLLFDYLLDIASMDEMVELSFKNVLMQKLDFGKYAGKYIEDIVMNDRNYLDWMLANITDLDEDVRYSICYYL